MDTGTLYMATVASALATAMTVVLGVRAVLASKAEAEAESAPAAGEAEPLPAPGGKWGGLASAMRPKTSEELGSLRQRLAQAGMRSPDTVDLFSVVRFLVLLGGLMLFFVMVITMGSVAMIPGSLVLGVAFLGPQLWLNSKIKTRQENLQLSLPPTLDLLVTCVEAGLGLEQAVARVASEIGFSDVEMAEELQVVVGEIRAGLTTAAAFRKLSERITSDELRNLANVIIQSSALGASLGRTLREYSSSARRRRELRLEEIAGKVTAGLTLPLTLCLLPSAMLAMLGPVIVTVVNSLAGT